MDEELHPRPRKGRGAISNPDGRFEARRRVAVDDGWARAGDEEEEDAPGPGTTLAPDASRSIIARNDSPDIPFDRSINPYRGCEHGCVYCYARPTHGWLGLSAGLDFETRIFFKPDAARLLRAAASSIGSSSWSVSAGISGAVITPTSTPAAASPAIASRRRAGEVARGSSRRARPRSSVVRDTKT
ncbi:MAG: hypothetical protein ACKOUS_23890, partial [Alphaproteobacteria bacterium]